MKKRMGYACITAIATAALAAAAGCTTIQARSTVPINVSRHVELQSRDMSSLNYSPDLIVMFGIESPAHAGVSGGGGPVGEFRRDGRPGETGVTCCTTLPSDWQPDLKLTVRWLAYMDDGNRVAKSWYKAESVRIPQYDGRQAGTTWAIFLPGHRVKIMVADENANGHNSVAVHPADNDPYVVQGVRDEESNRLYLSGSKQ